MFNFKNLRMAHKMAIQVGVFVLSLVAITFFSLHMITRVKVGGVLFQGINKNFDLVSDVSLPNLNTVNTQVAHFRMLTAKPTELPHIQEEANIVRSEFEDAYLTYAERFKKNTALKDHMDALHALMEKIFELRDSQVLPALRRGDRPTAERVLAGPINDNLILAQPHIDAILQAGIDQVVQDRKEADLIVAQETRWLFGLNLFCMVLAITIAFAIGRQISSPIQSVVALLAHLSAGDLRSHLEEDRQDEFGDLVRGLNAFTGRLAHSIRDISHNAQVLFVSAEELSGVGHRMTSNANETTSQANVVSAAAEEISKNTQVVAAASEEMIVSIKEIAKSVSEAAGIAGQAVKVAGSTRDIISKLSDSSIEIGKVIQVITSIAEQTNLLALNATIEAARAGDAGTGFAVVANEVKELAKETSKATDDIGRKIGIIQVDTKDAVEAIQRISSVINKINDIQSSIASAVEEQTATTHEIGRSVGEVARGSADIAVTITGVAKAAGGTSEGAANSQELASSLSGMASGLQKLVAQFKVEEDVTNKAA
jgi:methyl-accepting chemotaxis protein